MSVANRNEAQEAEACAPNGGVGALLRREELYSSHLSKWRQQYRCGALTALKDNKRGRKFAKNPAGLWAVLKKRAFCACEM